MRYTYPRITTSSASSAPGVILGFNRHAAYELFRMIVIVIQDGHLVS